MLPAALFNERRGAVTLLDAILQEEGDLDVLVLEESAQRLLGIILGAYAPWCLGPPPGRTPLQRTPHTGRSSVGAARCEASQGTLSSLRRLLERGELGGAHARVALVGGADGLVHQIGLQVERCRAAGEGRRGHTPDAAPESPMGAVRRIAPPECAEPRRPEALCPRRPVWTSRQAARSCQPAAFATASASSIFARNCREGGARCRGRVPSGADRRAVRVQRGGVRRVRRGEERVRRGDERCRGVGAG